MVDRLGDIEQYPPPNKTTYVPKAELDKALEINARLRAAVEESNADQREAVLQLQGAVEALGRVHRAIAYHLDCEGGHEPSLQLIERESALYADGGR